MGPLKESKSESKEAAEAEAQFLLVVKEVKIPSDCWSSLLKPGENLSILLYVSLCQPLPVAGFKDGSRYIRVLEWIKQHLADVSTLDTDLYKLEDNDLEFLRTMPNLQLLALRCTYQGTSQEH